MPSLVHHLAWGMGSCMVQANNAGVPAPCLSGSLTADDGATMHVQDSRCAHLLKRAAAVISTTNPGRETETA